MDNPIPEWATLLGRRGGEQLQLSGVDGGASTLQTFDGREEPAGAGAIARDEALEQVGGNAGTFMDQAMGMIDTITEGAVVTGEDIRRGVQRQGIEPHHHNAWGALISSAVRLGLITETGRWVPMQDKKSKARRTPEYYRTGVPYDVH